MGRAAGRVPLREAELARRWGAGAWRGACLHASDGLAYTVVFEGRRGGPAGPDFRDAVLLRADGVRLGGDVELHLRGAGWAAHRHARDSRYDGVVLHVVLHGAAGAGVPLANGTCAPQVVLGALPPERPAPPRLWPCRAPPLPLGELLLAAGWARFAGRVAGFADALAAGQGGGGIWPPADCLLFVALAEALAYGRDRVTLRALGERLAYGAPAEEMRTAAAHLPSVERGRVAGLLAWRARWEAAGPWARLLPLLAAGSPAQAVRALLGELRVPGGSVSPGRAAIALANVVLPAAAALATVRAEAEALARVHAVAAVQPGLPSNAIVRAMAAQLGLPRLPAGAVRQQGLHQLWHETCREKHCAACRCAAPATQPLVLTLPARPG